MKIEIACSECGAVREFEIGICKRNLTIDPCKHCISEEKEKAVYRYKNGINQLTKGGKDDGNV